MNKILTVSIAAYNVSGTIRECLDSFLESKYLDEIELLVINDGSSDETAKIVSAYEEQFPLIIKLINKSNGGHGSTINKSLSLADGKYFKIVDGDDWVDVKELDKLIFFLYNTDADLVINDLMNVYPDYNKRESFQLDRQLHKTYLFENIIPKENLEKTIFSMHSITILTQCLKDINMHIREKCFYADTEFIFFVGVSAQTIAFDDSCVYHYRLGVDGQSVSPQGIYKHIEDMFIIESDLMNLYNKFVKSKLKDSREKYLFAILETRFKMIFYWFTALIKIDKKDCMLLQYISSVKKEFPEIIKDMHLSIIDKCMLQSEVNLIPIIRFVRQSFIWSFLRKLKRNLQ